MTTRNIFGRTALALATLLSAGCTSLADNADSISPHPVAPRIPVNSVSLADFGKGDGQTLNTEAFEKAFAALAERGGGRLIVPPGIWLTGPVHFRSHTDLHLERGALVKFSGDFHLY